MYILTQNEQEYALSRAAEANRLSFCRGYDLPTPEVEPCNVSFSEVSSTFCPTKRNTYLGRVLGITPRLTEDIVKGGIAHATVALAFKKLKRAQEQGESPESVARELDRIASSDDSLTAALWEENGLENMKVYCEQEGFAVEEKIPTYLKIAKDLIIFEVSRFTRISEPKVGKIPKIADVERYFDGVSLGLGKARVDATIRLDNDTVVICDLKRKSFKDNVDGRVQIAGYALAMESILHIPISIGCLAFTEDRLPTALYPKRDVFVIDNKLRSEFISRKDSVMSLISEGKAPVLPTNAERRCVKCGYYYYCYEDEQKVGS